MTVTVKFLGEKVTITVEFVDKQMIVLVEKIFIHVLVNIFVPKAAIRIIYVNCMDLLFPFGLTTDDTLR